SSAAAWRGGPRTAPRRTGTSPGTARRRRSRGVSGECGSDGRPTGVRHGGREDLEHPGDLRLGRLAREREADDGARLGRRESQREEGRRRRERPARTGAAGGDRDAVEVEPHQERLAGGPGEEDRRGVGEALDGAADDSGARYAIEDPPLE